ncbi:tetratricopeptide repeat protein [Primorskyibacter sedentarius]|uniref:tetratricopeptide repeat protein n=1 Tax=Primorskyibacter sedentarius TaxID=745311 RepID=UPI00104FFB81
MEASLPRSIARTLGVTLLAVGLWFPAAVSANGLSGAYLAARQASYVGDYEAAAKYYNQALFHDPANPQLLERAVLANISLGNLDRAVELGQRLVNTGERSQIAQIALIAGEAKREAYTEILSRLRDDLGVGPLIDGLAEAWAEMGRGDMSAALVAFDEMSEQRGLEGFALYHKALALSSVGDHESAEAIFDSDSVGAMRMTRRAVIAQVEILSQLERNDDALKLIDTAFDKGIDPGIDQLRKRLEQGEQLPWTAVSGARQGIAEVFYTLAAALSNEADDDYTLLYSRVAEYLRPDHVDAILLSADMLERLEQHDLAVATYKRVPRDHPAYHAAELGRADALRADGKVDAAVEVLESLAETHGNLAVVQSTLGDLMRQLERYDDAVKAYDRALALFDTPEPTQWFLYYARAISHERQGNWPQAEADFRAALALNPEQPQVLNYLGYSLVEKNEKLDEALGMIERAVAARPDSGYIVDSLGWVLYRLGRYEEAVGHMERAAELMAIDPVVNDHLGDVYWSVGRKLEAEFMWKRALSFVDSEVASDEVDPERIRRKLEVGLDRLLAEEGAPPLKVANDNGG